MPNTAISGAIIHDAKACTACGTCELMCSLYHEGVQSPTLARLHVVRQPFSADHTFYSCQHCSSPECYLACPLRDTAIYIEADGTARINESECTGCEECINACPFDPPRIVLNPQKHVACKCDLCAARDGGPICIEYCPFKAIRLHTNVGG